MYSNGYQNMCLSLNLPFLRFTFFVFFSFMLLYNHLNLNVSLFSRIFLFIFSMWCIMSFDTMIIIVDICFIFSKYTNDAHDAKRAIEDSLAIYCSFLCVFLFLCFIKHFLYVPEKKHLIRLFASITNRTLDRLFG